MTHEVTHEMTHDDTSKAQLLKHQQKRPSIFGLDKSRTRDDFIYKVCESAEIMLSLS